MNFKMRKMQKNPNLPEEILIEIISRTSAKAVGRCRCLSKTWRTHLSTSQFAKLHLLNRTTSLQTQLLLISFVDDYDKFHAIDGPIAGNTVSSRKLDLGITWNGVLGSCNGLLLLSNRIRDIFLVNPTTHQHFKLPPWSLGSNRFGMTKTSYGLGYDRFSDDHKVLALTLCRGRDDRLIDVYSVKSGAWKRVCSSPDCRIYGIFFGAFVNGAIHAYSNINSVYVIEAFDLAADGVVHEIPVPPTKCEGGLIVLEGCLCMSSAYDNSGTIIIWMMKQYGLADSWTKFTIAIDMENLCRPPCSIGDGEIAFVSYHGTLVVYNIREGTTKVMVVDGAPAACLEGVAFLDSLVSPSNYSD